MRPVSRRAFVWVLLAYVPLRIYAATLPGYQGDLRFYKAWAVGTAKAGSVAVAYETAPVDYPPLYLYPLFALGKLYFAIYPDATPRETRDSRTLTFLVKSPPLLADLTLAALLAWLVSRAGSWGERFRDARWGRSAALLYLLNPAVVFDSGYWGQPDAMHSLLAVASLSALAFGAVAASGGFLAAAGLMKPLAAPLVPLVVVTSFRRSGLVGLLHLGAAGLAVTALLFLPFLWTGRIATVVERVLFDIDLMPYTSVNAHNLWWLLGSWEDADAPFLGPLTPKVIGLALFLSLYAAVLWRGDASLRAASRDGSGTCGAHLFVAAAAVVCSFFLVSTHLHENHLFMAVPLLLAVAGRSRTLALLAAACSLAVFANIALHDLSLPYTLPGWLAEPSPIENPALERPFTWLQLVGSYANALLITALTGRLCLLVLRRERLGE